MRKLVTLDEETTKIVIGLENEGYSFSKLCVKLITEFALERESVSESKREGEKIGREQD